MTQISRQELPGAVSRYFAHRLGDDAALDSIFTPDARVVDDGAVYSGLAEVAGWISASETSYRYTVTFLDADADADAVEETVTVRNRLEGDFPGAVVDLRYFFRLRNGLIADLVIAP